MHRPQYYCTICKAQNSEECVGHDDTPAPVTDHLTLLDLQAAVYAPGEPTSARGQTHLAQCALCQGLVADALLGVPAELILSTRAAEALAKSSPLVVALNEAVHRLSGPARAEKEAELEALNAQRAQLWLERYPELFAFTRRKKA